MKKVMSSSILILATAALSAQTIQGTSHDFSQYTPSGEICVVCHTPHNANTDVPNSPLWNHQVTSQTFTPYSTTSLDAEVGQPSGVSKLCLSCHDGATAVDNYGGTTTGTWLITGREAIGTDLRNDHPVSFVYDQALAAADGELKDPTSAVTALGGTIQTDLLSEGSTVECTSCHDVHNGYSYNPEFLKITMNGSALCLTCHDK
ncbi:MAG: cytochrome C [Candidatus Neomarinimicrobiota bacterium]|nr:MAG: cytochrome C [Candidatus Neomarinimicrobiota bacterium]